MKKRYGYAIPLCLCVAAVTLFLGLSAAQMTATDLKMASHQYYQERARQVAEFGLQKRLTQVLTLNSVYPLGVGHPDDRASVQVFDNRLGAQPLTPAGCPVTIPAGCQYWISSGEARDGTRLLGQAKVGGMVRWGQPLGSAGAQINSLDVIGAGSGVTYQTLDGLTGNPVADEFIVSSSALGPDALGAPLKFSEIAGFGGKIRLPQGGSTTAVDYTRTLGPLPGSTFSQDGGQINLPPYSPPLKGTYVSSLRISSSQTLPAGHYGTLTLDPAMLVTLQGLYYVEHLIVSPGPNPLLVVPQGNRASFFVDDIQGAPRWENGNLSAQNLKFYVKPGASRIDMMAGVGGATVVAPGHLLHVSASVLFNRIRGSFCCEHLETVYNPGPLPPTFVYDISANQSRNSSAANTRDPVGPSVVSAGGSRNDGPMLLSLQVL